MEEILESKNFLRNDSLGNFQNHKGMVYARKLDLDEGDVQMVINSGFGVWDAWLWVDNKTSICLKLGFKPEDFSSPIIQQLLLNP